LPWGLSDDHRVLTHHPTGLNGHPVVEEFVQRLAESGRSRVPFYSAFLVDRMEETMRQDKSRAEQLLAQAEKVTLFIPLNTFCIFDSLSACIIQFTVENSLLRRIVNEVLEEM
jgi:hypothetical protein